MLESGPRLKVDTVDYPTTYRQFDWNGRDGEWTGAANERDPLRQAVARYARELMEGASGPAVTRGGVESENES